MQSWGTRSRFDDRDTELEPSKSGVLGLACAALGIDRSNWASLEPLTQLRMGVRVEREGILQRDYHTAQNVLRASGDSIQETAVSIRHYLADASFLVGLEGAYPLLEKLHIALKNPHWPLALGRKSFVPSQSIWLADGLTQLELEQALRQYPLPNRTSATLRLVLEAPTGSLRMDQPIASFAERRFGARFVRSLSLEVSRVPE